MEPGKARANTSAAGPSTRPSPSTSTTRPRLPNQPQGARSDASLPSTSRGLPNRPPYRPSSAASSASGGSASGDSLRNGAQPRVPVPLGTGSSIIVNERQRGNPLLTNIRNVPWEFGNITPDYVMGVSACALFLSLKYHNLNPEYIHERLKSIGKKYELEVLLVLVDVKDPHHPLKELAKMAIMAEVTLIPAWSPEEAGKYVELYKIYENKPADMIKAQVEGEYMPQLTEALTTVKSVNKTDAKTLSVTFKSFSAMTRASKEELALLPGFGVQKAQRFHDVLHQPFWKKRKVPSRTPSPEKRKSLEERPASPEI